MKPQNFENVKSRLREIVPAGLVIGAGVPEPGKLCIESAICLALGEPHGDTPSCVAESDRAFAIALNDATWSSPEVRAQHMLPIGLVQLGTNGVDRSAWVSEVVNRTIREIVPIALRAAASVHPEQKHRYALEQAAVACEKDGSKNAAVRAADAARAATAAYAARAAYAAADAARAAAAHAADAAAYAARAARAADAAAYARDKVLIKMCQIALDAYAAEGRVP